MSDDPNDANPIEDPLTVLRDRCEHLERELVQVKQRADSGIIKAHLQAMAAQANMIDLDGLKMLDLSQVTVTEGGEVHGATQLMEKMRKEKPWLFGKATTSWPIAAPPSQPPRQKSAMEMTDTEYKAAREAIVRHRL